MSDPPYARRMGSGARSLRSLRWPRVARIIAPPAAVAAVITTVALTHGAAADVAAPTLAPKTADQLLAMVQKADVAGLSGTVVERSALGLPSLPESANTASAAGLLGMLTGKHTLRVWVGGTDQPGKFRAQILDQLDETELVATGTSVWSYTYSTNQATELRVPPESARTHRTAPGTPPVTPDQTAAALLGAFTNSTSIDTAGTARVAGRNAYVLAITPLTNATTIGRISIDIDAATGIPLQLQVFARGASSPAASIGYSSVSFAAVSPSVFTFTPPPGAHVSVTNLHAPAAGMHPELTGAQVVGTGWASVLVVPDVSLNNGYHARGRQAENLSSLVARIGQRVPGGTLITTTLVNALLTDDGRLLIGAVPASTLQSVATSAPTK